MADEIKTLVEWLSAFKDIGFVGLLTILAVPRLRWMLGFDSMSDAIAVALKTAFADENKSPILVKAQIERICDDISEIRENQIKMGEDVAFIKGKLDS